MLNAGKLFMNMLESYDKELPDKLFKMFRNFSRKFYEINNSNCSGAKDLNFSSFFYDIY